MDMYELLSPPTTIQSEHGLHLLGEWYGCNSSSVALKNAEALRVLCLLFIKNSGLKNVGDIFHQFSPHGVSGAVLLGESNLGESHLAIHTRPGEAMVMAEVYVSNFREGNSANALKLYTSLKSYFQPARENFSRLPTRYR